MFKNKILIFIILMIALLSIGIASAEESSMNATDTVSLDYDDSSTEVVTSAYDGNTSLDVVSEDNSQLQCENNSETFSRDVKTFNDFSNENTIDDLKSSNYNDDNGVVSLNELNVVSTMDNRANMSDVETAGFFAGFVPFIPLDIVKCIAAVLIAKPVQVALYAMEDSMGKGSKQKAEA